MKEKKVIDITESEKDKIQKAEDEKITMTSKSVEWNSSDTSVLITYETNTTRMTWRNPETGELVF
jgi:hypothetical protein